MSQIPFSRSLSFQSHLPQASTHANRGRNFVARPEARIKFLLEANVSSIHFYCFMIKLICIP